MDNYDNAKKDIDILEDKIKNVKDDFDNLYDYSDAMNISFNRTD